MTPDEQLLHVPAGLRELHLQSNGIVPNQDLLDKLAGLRSLTALDIGGSKVNLDQSAGTRL